ncbi:MAG: alpha/beta hydrolase [Candidatus Micrarchaeia archaeon]|jgi:pimeloyl-ACP methyl ester carboxylesterase
MGTVLHGKYSLYYEVKGQGSRSIILIHGLCGNHEVWSKTISAFSNGYKVITLDMFGHGNSSNKIPPKEAFDSMPEMIAKIIEKEGLEKVVLVGHSIAGNILCKCIEGNLKNVCGYVFVDCTFNASKRVVNSRNRLADSLIGSSSEQTNLKMVAWYKTMMDMNAQGEDNKIVLSALENLDGKWIVDFLKATNFVRQPPKIDLPVAIFESDWLTRDEPERSFHNAVPHTVYHHWPVQNHFFFIYGAQKFNFELQKFLDRVL